MTTHTVAAKSQKTYFFNSGAYERSTSIFYMFSCLLVLVFVRDYLVDSLAVEWWVGCSVYYVVNFYKHRRSRVATPSTLSTSKNDERFREINTRFNGLNWFSWINPSI